MRVSHNNFGTVLVWLAILHEDDVLLEEDGGGVHHTDEESVDVVLEVGDLLALALHSALEPDQHFNEVLKHEPESDQNYRAILLPSPALPKGVSIDRRLR